MTLASDIAVDLVAVQAAISAAGALKGAGFTTIAPVLASVQKLSDDIAVAVDLLNEQITPGMDGGGNIDGLAPYLLSQMKIVTDQAALLTAGAYVDRMIVNLTWSVGA